MSARALLTRLGRRIAARIEVYQGSPGCCTCGKNMAAWEYQNACRENGAWDWAQRDGCHNGSDEHAVRTLTYRRYEEASR